MGLRCLLGHDFDEPELEREREEQGNEVIVSVREVRVCARCGYKQVVSENKEVTSIDQLSAQASGFDDGYDEPKRPATPTAADPTADSRPEAVSATAGTGAETGADDAAFADSDDRGIEEPAVTDDAELITEGPGDVGAGGELDPTAAEDFDDPEPTAEEDDGVILTEELEAAERGERQHGQWPAAESDLVEESAAAAPTPWPEHDDEDEGFSASLQDDRPTDVSFSGFTPDLQEAESASAAADRVESGDGFTKAASLELEFDDGGKPIETEFFCPECDLTRPTGASSIRPGDICPECRRGYISERPT
ncbi:DUF7093 family protein [Haloferacaceae archaeon DSL9]